MDLRYIPDQHVRSSTYLDLQKYLRRRYPTKPCLVTFQAFSSLNAKKHTVQHGFACALMRQSGMSAEKTVDMVRRWPTPRHLWEDVKLRLVQGEPEPPPSRKLKKAETLANWIEQEVGDPDRRRAVKSALSANLWYLYTSRDYDSSDAS